MTQHLETYYGFKLGVAKEIEASGFSRVKGKLSAALHDIEAKTGRKFSAYISMCQFLIKKDKCFGVGPLYSRLSELSLRWQVNKEERVKGTLFFINDQVQQESIILDEAATHSFSKHEIVCKLSGTYVHLNDSFRLFIIAAIDDSVKPNRRKVSLSAVASPTADYASRFRNSNGRKQTTLEYNMNRSVQLLLDLQS